MKTPIYFSLIFSISILFFSFQNTSAQTFDGYALYNPLGSNTTYLVDKNQNIAHSWSCSLTGNYTVHLKEDGNLIRGGVYGSNILNAPAVSGIIQELNPSANIVWEYIYSTSNVISHHDFAVLPNGNVILTAFEVKTPTELTQAGYDGATSDKWPTHFIELQPDGAGGANIVWEWHMWDHMVQDFDITKSNYGSVSGSSELMDINAITGGFGPPGSGDWFHVNGIDYNPTLDQLVFSSRYASEFYIIDHSTTTAEAATNAGGNAGMGGDFLYRYGNPPNYGAASPQIIPAAVHDPRWIKAGRPNAGYIQFFNNEGAGGSSSTVDAINPPLSGFNYTGFTPSTYDWRHNTIAFSSGQSASDRMTNGNTFVNVSGQYMYEVDSLNNVIWQHADQSGKAFRYECDYVGLAVLLGPDPCGLLIGVDEFSEANVNVFPNPTSGIVNVTGIWNDEMNFEVNVYDVFGKLVMKSNNDTRIDLSAFNNGFYVLHLTPENGQSIVKKISLIK